MRWKRKENVKLQKYFRFSIYLSCGIFLTYDKVASKKKCKTKLFQNVKNFFIDTFDNVAILCSALQKVALDLLIYIDVIKLRLSEEKNVT